MIEKSDPEVAMESVERYNLNVMDHFFNPRNIGELPRNHYNGFSITGDSACGDQLYLWIRVEGGIIEDIKFKSFGCPGAIATSSMMTVLAKGKTIEEASRITDTDVIEALGGIPEPKKHCSLLGIVALRQAIGDYKRRESKKKEND